MSVDCGEGFIPFFHLSRAALTSGGIGNSRRSFQEQYAAFTPVTVYSWCPVLEGTVAGVGRVLWTVFFLFYL